MSTDNVDVKTFFSERLRELRGRRKKAEFARFLGVSAQTYQNYEDGRIPAATALAEIAARCNVAVEYLIKPPEHITDPETEVRDNAAYIAAVTEAFNSLREDMEESRRELNAKIGRLESLVKSLNKT